MAEWTDPRAKWLPATYDWLTKNIPTMEDIYTNPTTPWWGKAAIGATSQAARPIGAIAGAVGNLQSEGNTQGWGVDDEGKPITPTLEQEIESNKRQTPVMPDVMAGQEMAPKSARKAVNLLDVLGVASGAGAAATGSRALGMADVAFSGLDAAMGGGDVATGISEGDPAKIAMGAARIAGNAYGGTKALQDLGIKISDAPTKVDVEEAFEFGPRALEKTDGRKTVARNMTSGGKDYTIRAGPEATQAARNMLKSPGFNETLSDQVDFLYRVGDAFDSDDLVGSVGRASEAKYVDDFTPERIGEGVKVKKIHVNLDGDEYGSTLTAKDQGTIVPDRPVMFNPIAQAKRVSNEMRFLTESDVDPALLERALADVPEDVATYARGIRAGEARIPELETKYAAILYARNLFYNMGHEKVGHWLGATQHRKSMSLSGQPTGPLLEKAPDYKDVLAAKDGTTFELQPRQVSMDEKLSRGTTLFEPANNAVVTAIKDPTRLTGIKQYMASDEFLDRAKTWYRSALEQPEMKVAKRSDRVIGRAEAKIAQEEAAGQSPTPPGQVPPGAGAPGEPQGPQLPSLATRIKSSLKENVKARNLNDLKKREINTVKAEALRANEEKLASQMISVEDFHAERAKIMKGDYGLINKVQEMPISEAEKASMVQQIVQQSQDDAFVRNRAQIAFDKMVKGERLEDNEIKLIREVIGDRLKINEEDPTILKLGKFFANATGSTRALMTAYDISAAGRQALYAAPMNPGAVKEAFKAQIQALKMTRHEFDSFMARLKDPMYNPFAEISEAAGLHFSETMEHATGKQEEAFYGGKWAEAIPGVRQSEQAYIAYLNKIRVEIFNKHAKVMLDAGEELIDPETGAASQKMQDLAYMVNTLTGRGELSAIHTSPNSFLGKKFKLRETLAPGKDLGDKSHQALTTVFFAPRFAASRAALMRDTVQAMVGGGLDPAVSKIYMKNVVGTIGAVTSTMAALAAMGVGTFQPDPRKKDFGVLKVGNTRYDVYGGLKQWAKIVSVIGTDSYFSGKYSLKKQYGASLGSKTKTGEVGNFIKGKLSPTTGFLLEAMTGEDFMGRKSQLWRNAYEHSFPMIIQTIAESVEANEADQLPLAVPLSLVGVGVNSYTDKRFKKGQ